jgi:hypothetical protein
MDFQLNDRFVLSRVEKNSLPANVGTRNRVPQVKYLSGKVYAKTTDVCTVVLQFEEPVTPQYEIVGYLVYVSGLNGTSTNQISETLSSPAWIQIPTPQCDGKVLVFSIQTRLSNGFTSDIDFAATTAVSA